MNKHIINKLLAILLSTSFFPLVYAGQTLNAVKERGHLICGVSDGLTGFSKKNEEGQWSGLDVDYCRAVAAAVFGDKTKVKFVPTSAANRFDILNSGEIDILARNSTWTIGRETEYKINFAGVNFYDGQGFMIKKDLGVYSVMHLNGASICVESNTTNHDNLVDFFKEKNMRLDLVEFDTVPEVNDAFFSGKCDVYTADSSSLASVRVTDAPKPYDYMILPEVISKEPLGPSVKAGDFEWFNITRWVLNALITAEELGITKENIDDKAHHTGKPEVKRLLGIQGSMGKKLKLSDKWAYRAIKAVGNYGEIFKRNVGIDSDLKLSRGMNELWSKGGLLYSAPVR